MVKLSRLTALFLFVIFFLSSCTLLFGPRKPRIPPKANYEEGLKDGDTIPGEFILTYDKSVTEDQKDSLESRINIVYEFILDSILLTRDSSVSENDTMVIMRVPCECGELVELYRIICPEAHDQMTSTAGSGVSEESWDQPSVSGGATVNEEEYAPYSDRTCVGEESHDAFAKSVNQTVKEEGLKDLVVLEPNRWINKDDSFPQQMLDSIILASEVTSPGEGKIIAITDSGLKPLLIDQFAHEHKLWRNSAKDSCSKIVNNIGYSFYDNSRYIFDHSGHGTVVADILDDQLSQQSICKYEFMILKIFGPSGGSTFDAACSIIYASNHGADVINASWGIYFPSMALEQAVTHMKNREVILVTSSGNRYDDLSSSDSQVHYPSDFVRDIPNYVVAVGALDESMLKLWKEPGTMEDGSNYYLDLDVLTDHGFVAERGDFNPYFMEYTLYPSATTPDPLNLLRKVGTSFATPIATAKIVASSCCRPEKHFWDNATVVSTTVPPNTTLTDVRLITNCNSMMLPIIGEMCE